LNAKHTYSGDPVSDLFHVTTNPLSICGFDFNVMRALYHILLEHDVSELDTELSNLTKAFFECLTKREETFRLHEHILATR